MGQCYGHAVCQALSLSCPLRPPPSYRFLKRKSSRPEVGKPCGSSSFEPDKFGDTALYRLFKAEANAAGVSGHVFYAWYQHSFVLFNKYRGTDSYYVFSKRMQRNQTCLAFQKRLTLLLGMPSDVRFEFMLCYVFALSQILLKLPHNIFSSFCFQQPPLLDASGSWEVLWAGRWHPEILIL